MRAEPYKSESEQALLERLIALMESLEGVFFQDWDHSQDQIEESVLCQGRVPNPLDVEEPVGNWSNKENLANSYLKLRAFMISENLLPSDFQNPMPPEKKECQE